MIISALISNVYSTEKYSICLVGVSMEMTDYLGSHGKSPDRKRVTCPSDMAEHSVAASCTDSVHTSLCCVKRQKRTQIKENSKLRWHYTE